jgi:hypothetical protein
MSMGQTQLTQNEDLSFQVQTKELLLMQSSAQPTWQPGHAPFVLLAHNPSKTTVHQNKGAKNVLMLETMNLEGETSSLLEMQECLKYPTCSSSHHQTEGMGDSISKNI